MVYKVLIINLMGLILCIGQNPTLYLNIVRRESKLTCEATTVTVLEGEPLRIEVKHDRYISSIKLSRRNNNRVWSTIDERFININEIYRNMGTVWTCTVEALQGLPTSHKQQTQKGGNYNYETIQCQIKMRVRRKEAPQVILVNGMLLSSKRAPLNESYDTLAEYTFNDGDLVDVTCANPKTIQQPYYLTLGYDYLKRFQNHKNSSVLYSPGYPVGFKFRMRAANDETHAICTAYVLSPNKTLDTTSTVRVNFHMRKRAVGSSVNVYINDAALSPTTVNENKFEYRYKPNEYLRVICESVQVGDTRRFSRKIQPKWKDIYNEPMTNEKDVTLYPLYHMPKSFQCVSGTDEIVVKLIPREVHEEENVCSMRVWIEHSNAIVEPLFELYQPGVHYFIYEYKDYDMLYFLCEEMCKMEGYEIFLASSGRNIIHNIKRTADVRLTRYKNISKSEIDEDNAFKWVIQERTTKRPVLISNIMFIRTPRTPARPAMHFVTDPIKEGSSNWVLPLAGSVSCIVIICVIVVIYKMRTRWNHKSDEQPGDVNYKNLPKDVDDPIPPFPLQWDFLNTEFVNQNKDSTYSNPSTGPCGHAENELYNIPMPIDPRNADQHNMTNELNYAEIMHVKNLDPDAKVPKTRPKLNGNDDPNYVQVLVQNVQGMERDGAGSMYANVHDGRYATNSEYAEPTYCEPTYLIKKN